MMKVWNMSLLVSSTFFLCIFGTFLTRSGVVQNRCTRLRSRHWGDTSRMTRSWRWELRQRLYLSSENRLDYLKSEAPARCSSITRVQFPV